MTIEARILIVGLAAFGFLGLVATLLSLALANVIGLFVAGPSATGSTGRSRSTRGSAAQRAARLADLRLLPTAIAGVGGLIVAAAFILFEPRWDGENIGTVVPLAAAFAAALLTTTCWRGFRLVLATRRTTQAWLRHAQPITLRGISAPALVVDSTFPVVTVIGLRRPRLMIARSVLDSCSPDELLAILAHEQGHIDRHDNLRRLLLSIAPDILNWLPVSAKMFAAWCDAAEEAADDDAARTGADGRVRLAEALVKVARLAPVNGVEAPMPASALYRGESLERRVRRLLEARHRETSSFAPVWSARAALTVLSVAGLTVLERVHELVEGLIHSLP
jgi:Zn-dependent protease with chaperone function